MSASSKLFPPVVFNHQTRVKPTYGRIAPTRAEERAVVMDALARSRGWSVRETERALNSARAWGFSK